MQNFQRVSEAQASAGHKARGVISGVGKGIMGVFTKPIGGAAELVSQTGYGEFLYFWHLHLNFKMLFRYNLLSLTYSAQYLCDLEKDLEMPLLNSYKCCAGFLKSHYIVLLSCVTDQRCTATETQNAESMK